MNRIPQCFFMAPLANRLLFFGCIFVVGCSSGQKPYNQMKGHTTAVRCVRFSPDGKTLATTAGERGIGSEVILWDVATGNNRAELKGHKSVVVSLAFSPNGRSLATQTLLFDETIRMWNAATGEELFTLKQEGCVTSMAFSPDGNTLVVSGLNTLGVTLWDVEKQMPRSTLANYGDVRELAISPDGKVLAGNSGMLPTVNLWMLATQEHYATLTKHSGSVNSVVFSPDSKTLATADLWTVRLWDVASGTEKAALEHGKFEVSGGDFTIASVDKIAFSADGGMLATVASDHTIKLWDLATGQERAMLRGQIAAFSPVEESLAMAFGDTVTIWDLATLNEGVRFPSRGGIVTDLAYSPDGAILASGSADATVRLWDVKTLRK